MPTRASPKWPHIGMLAFHISAADPVIRCSRSTTGSHPPPYTGTAWMLVLDRNRLSGSYVALTLARRS